MKRRTEDLAEHTWLKVGGPAEIAIPESKAAFVDVLKECESNNREYRILGNGSNLLISDSGVDELVIKSTDACTSFEVDGTTVTAGASITVPQLINKCVSENLGGIEYLYSVPGTVGGAIYMNAGRGRLHNMTITDHLRSVEVFADGEVRSLNRDELQFEHRYSTFHDHDDWVILEATFDFPDQPIEEGKEKISKRMEKVGERERSGPNAGSVFKSGARLPLHRIPPNGLSVGSARFVSSNRIAHDGTASSKDIKRLVLLGKLLNWMYPPFKQPKVEWDIWE